LRAEGRGRKGHLGKPDAAIESGDRVAIAHRTTDPI